MGEPQKVDLWALADLTTPWCLLVAATLRIAEHIQAGHERVEQLAEAAQCDPYVLNCVLGTLTAKGVFAEPEPGRFILNEAAIGLMNPALRLGRDLEGIGGRMAYAWGTLPKYLRTGVPAYRDVFGTSFWEDMDAHPALAESFDALLGPPGHGVPSPDIELAAGWHSVHTVVDVGGGTGAMLAEVLKAHPDVRGILVERPGTAERAECLLQSAGVAHRVAISVQSFFDPLPPGAGVYLLRGVLNNWDDAEAVSILKRCAEAARPGGRVVVLKSVGPDDRPRHLNVSMLLVGGKDRTVSEFRDLAHRAGLEIVAARQQPAYFVVECLPRPAGVEDIRQDLK